MLAVEKRITSSLMEKSSVEKIMEVDSHIGAAISGLTADARTLVEHARVESQYHRFTYDEPLRLESLAQSVCDLAIAFGEDDNTSKMSRPFGVSLLLAGVGDEGPQLICTDPSGTLIHYAAHAIGNGSEGARTLLEEKYHRSMSLREATQLVATVLRQTMEERITADNIEIATVTPRGGFKFLSRDDLTEILAAAEAAAGAEGSA